MRGFESTSVYTLTRDSGLQIQVMEEGASLLSCLLPMPTGDMREVVLGCRDLEAYRAQKSYIGAVIGRFSNRLRNAECSVDGETIPLTSNCDAHQLHGGSCGFDKKKWSANQTGTDTLSLDLVSPDGDQGFPGDVRAQVIYQLLDDMTLEIRMEATVTKACPIGLTHHAYFNLDGDHGKSNTSCLDHELQVHADYWMPLDNDGISAAALRPVRNTGLDFRKPQLLAKAVEGDPILVARKGIDHSLSLLPGLRNANAVAAVLTSSDGRVSMELSTNQPAIQVYTGIELEGAVARDGSVYRSNAGIALEPQFIPDSPNRPVSEPYWPDCILRPGDVWRSTIRMKFITR